MDEISQRQKREVLKDCYLNRAQAEADMIGGRFRQQSQTHVTGAPSYPAQPSHSPWAQGIDQVVGPEAPLGDTDFVGELGGESSSAPVSATVETTANATSDGGPLAPPKGRVGVPS